MAVSGANFAVAETGTLVVVESEGNGRMCLTLPEVLVSVVGIEKVVPTFADLDVFLRLLPRSSTGERMNPYTSTWTGVTPGDGPQEVHVVLLDNGRTRALADEVGRQALRCIRCSACLNVCPVYERAGGHAYGSVYPGPIGAILNPLMKGVGVDEQTDSLPYASSLCGACYEVCPVKIDIPSVLVDLRAQVVDAHRGGVPQPEAVAMKGAAATFALLAPAAAWPSGSTGLGTGLARRLGLAPGAGPAPATCPPRRPSPSGPGGSAPTAGRAMSGARERDPAPGPREATRAAAATAGRARQPRARRGHRVDVDLFVERVADYQAVVERCAADELAGRVAAVAGRRCRSSCPTGSGFDGARLGAPTTASPPPSSTRSTPWSPRRPSASPRPARSCSTTAPARAAARSRWCPTCTSAWSAPTRSSPTSRRRRPARPGPAPHLDQRPLGHQRHRARPGRGRPRPPHACTSSSSADPLRPAQPGVLRPQSQDLGLQRQHAGDAGEVEALGEQVTDPDEPVEVVLAVEAGAPGVRSGSISPRRS